MQILYEPTKYFLYAFDYKFSMELLEFCRWIKDQVGWKKFNFTEKKWRFSDLEVVDLIKNRFDSLELDDTTQQNYRIYNLEKAQTQLVEKKAQQLKKQTDSSLVIKGLKGELYPFQKIGVEFFINNNGKAILSDQMGCLSGETKIIINRGGNARQHKIKDIYNKFNKTWDKNILTKTRSLQEDKKEFRLNVIQQVNYAGKQKVLEIKARNKNKTYTIKLTKDHELINDNYQWKEAQTFKLGDKLLVNGKLIKYCHICKKKTEHSTYKYHSNYGQCKKCIYRFKRNNYPNKNYESLDKSGYVLVGGMYFHPHFKQNGNNGIRKHILVYESFENKMSYQSWVNACRYNQLPSSAKFIDSKKYNIHHKNGIKNDNRLKNLQKYTISEHQRYEGKHNTYKNLAHTFIPETTTIISIKEKGLEDVYDIVMEDPHRNFIANGIVVHNCGKSLQSLAYIVHQKIEKTLVVCPASVKYSWENEVYKWTNLKPLVIDSRSQLDIQLFKDYDIFIINYDILAKFFNFLTTIHFNCLILDEFHYIKSTSAKRTKLTVAIAKKIPSNLLLSGTPLLNRPVELFTGLHLMDPKMWNNWYEYTKKFCAGHQGFWGYDYRGASNISELQQKISRYFLRRKKEDILPELPPKQFVDFPVELDADARFKYNLVLGSFVDYLREVKRKNTTEIRRTLQAEKLVRLGELRLITTNGKIQAATELIQNIIDGEEKVIVFSCYNEPLEKLYQHFKKESVLLTGQTPELMRKKYIEAFQKQASVKIFFGGIKSAGVGITLTAASNVVFLDYSWVPADHQQAQDRCHRLGQEAESITIYQLYSKNTIDEKMKDILAKKQAIFDKLIEKPDSTKQITFNLIDDIITDIKKDNQV